MLGTIPPIVGGISDRISSHKFGNTRAESGAAAWVLGALDGIRARILRLNGHIFYALGITRLSGTAGAARQLCDLREVRALLEPMHAALGRKIVSFGLRQTPDKMERAMVDKPWTVLEDRGSLQVERLN